ncbi:MAG TPA: transcription antitermination factor NusB, partial [Gemmatimonadales bacterium]
LEDLVPGLAGITGSPPAVMLDALALASGVIGRQAEIDAAFVRAAEHWRLDRLALVDRNILRLGVYELLSGSAPPKVVIDEALWLAHRFGGRESAGFVNGVLDSVARSLGLL